MGEWREEWREANRANWDERVPIHVSGEFYDVASFKGGQERLQPFEIEEVGDVLEKSGFDTYRLPEGTPRIPLMYSLRARK
jgi:hypothetical protein